MYTSINTQELDAVEGLLGLHSHHYLYQNSSQVSVNSQDSSDHISVQLNPISPMQSNDERLPPLSQISAPVPAPAPPNAYASTCSLNYILSTPMCPSMRSSCSSTSSFLSSYASSISSASSSSTQEHTPQQATRRTLRRTTAYILNANRRGRPRKPNSTTSSSSGNSKKNKEIKIINCGEYEKTSAATNPCEENITVVSNKPRWQDSERQNLIEAIVHEKKLDDMTSIPWDKVSRVVGRAKKACKDQWRREVLPSLLKGFVRGGNNKNNNNNSGNS